jgi:hypothetical protein
MGEEGQRRERHFVLQVSNRKRAALNEFYSWPQRKKEPK